MSWPHGAIRMTVTFETVRHQAGKNLPCPSCGKKTRRQKTFTNTVNPYNTDPETGLPRTRQQILRKLEQEAEAWGREPETCTRCLAHERRTA